MSSSYVQSKRWRGVYKGLREGHWAGALEPLPRIKVSFETELVVADS